MKRKVIEIDLERCTGCGQCIPNCPEGALQIIDGKARLVSERCCDGLGACLGECPEGALQVVEREAEAYDECRVMEKIIPQGIHTLIAHLRHLKNHGESALLEEALELVRCNHLELPAEVLAELTATPEGSPAPVPAAASAPAADGTSELRQWPTQLALIAPEAGWFDGAELLVAADCVPFALGDFHARLLRGRRLVHFCPKLDARREEYIETLAELFRKQRIPQVVVARMEVPCCGGTVVVVREALARAGRAEEIPLRVQIVSCDGREVRNA